MGQEWGVTAAMPSPSYTLMNAHQGRCMIYHIDLYRLESPDELWELGWTQLGERGEIVLVEWPGRAGDLMPPDHWVIELSIPEGAPTLRDVEVHRVGSPPELPAFPLSLVSRG